MKKNLVNMVPPVVLSVGVLLAGCGAPYKDTLKPGNWTSRQKQFVNDAHRIYGEQITYDELKGHIRNNLGKYEAKIVNHFLKDYVRKEDCRDNISDEALVVISEAIRKLD